MPDTFVDAGTWEDPSILIDGVEFQCIAHGVQILADDDEIDISTFCNPKGTRPGATDWTVNIMLRLNYGIVATAAGVTATAGTWNTLNAWRKLSKEVVIKPADAAVALGNPSFTFDAYIPTISALDSEVAGSEAQTIELVLSPIGDPVVSVGA